MLQLNLNDTASGTWFDYVLSSERSSDFLINQNQDKNERNDSELTDLIVTSVRAGEQGYISHQSCFNNHRLSHPSNFAIAAVTEPEKSHDGTYILSIKKWKPRDAFFHDSETLITRLPFYDQCISRFVRYKLPSLALGFIQIRDVFYFLAKDEKGKFSNELQWRRLQLCQLAYDMYVQDGVRDERFESIVVRVCHNMVEVQGIKYAISFANHVVEQYRGWNSLPEQIKNKFRSLLMDSPRIFMDSLHVRTFYLC